MTKILKTDTFSANSLKLLNKSTEEFKIKYEQNLCLIQDNQNAKAGENLHKFLCYYLKDFDTSKIEAAFSMKDKNFIEDIKNLDAVKILKSAHRKFIEQPFLVKCHFQDKSGVFYLTGRYDAVLIKNDSINIYDWKSANIPDDPEFDIQTITYLYSASKLYKTKNVSIEYVSLTKDEAVKVCYNTSYNYFEKIESIVNKLKA